MSDDAVRRQIFQDFGERTTTFKISQDVEPQIELNKRLRDIDQPNTDGMKHLAAIPVIILNQWLQAEWDRGNRDITLASREFQELIRRKLRDPDWAHLLVAKPLEARRR